jgi:hypothetical protein
MLLRRISQHLKNQNWFAVGLDFFIVVTGILIAFQITNWNEARQAKGHEQAILFQLKEEFTQIKAALEKQNSVRAKYVENIGVLIAAIEGTTSRPDDTIIKVALDDVRSTGRRPAQSAAYLQLMANGQLATLSNSELQKALVRYDIRLQRDAFIFPELMKIVIEEISTNKFVDYDISRLENVRAAIDRDTNIDQGSQSENIRSYDMEGLRNFENRYEAMFIMHSALLESDKTQLELANQILNQIAREDG